MEATRQSGSPLCWNIAKITIIHFLKNYFGAKVMNLRVSNCPQSPPFPAALPGPLLDVGQLGVGGPTLLDPLVIFCLNWYISLSQRSQDLSHCQPGASLDV